MSKRDRDLISDLETLGYEFDHANSKGVRFYLHPDTGSQVGFPLGVDESRARGVARQARQLIGLPTKDNKRNPAQIRERNAAEHAKAARELEAARKSLAAVGALDAARLRDAEAAYLAAERRFAWWDRLMRETGNAA